MKSAGSGGLNADIGRAIALDKDKNILIGGQITGVAYFDGRGTGAHGQRDFFIAKYDSLGNILWVKKGGSWAAGGHGYDFTDDIETDSAGNIYIGGYIGRNASFQSYPFPSPSGAFICKLDPDGNLLWANSFFTNSDPAYDRVKGILDLDREGNVYFGTNFIDQIDLHDSLLVMPNFPGKDVSNNIILMKFDPDGNRLWFRTGNGFYANLLEDIKVDAVGDVIIFGHNKWAIDFGLGPLGGQNWLVKYSDTGTLLWAINPPFARVETAKAMDIDEQNNIYLLNRSNAREIGVQKMSPEGNLIWDRVAGESGFLTPNNILFQEGVCYTTGWFQDSLTHNNSYEVAKGVKDIFLVSMDAQTGARRQGIRAGSDALLPGYIETGYDLIGDGKHIYMVGAYKGDADFQQIQMRANGQANDIFFAKLSPGITSRSDATFEAKIELFPNPSSGSVKLQYLDHSDWIKELSLFSLDGKKVYELKVDKPQTEIQVNLDHLESGSYFLKLISREDKLAIKKLLLLKN
ncbi:MAG: T9SS type A sorting domain-containing protein [Bacteroidota bacterium]